MIQLVEVHSEQVLFLLNYFIFSNSLILSKVFKVKNKITGKFQALKSVFVPEIGNLTHIIQNPKADLCEIAKKSKILARFRFLDEKEKEKRMFGKLLAVLEECKTQDLVSKTIKNNNVVHLFEYFPCGSHIVMIQEMMKLDLQELFRIYQESFRDPKSIKNPQSPSSQTIKPESEPISPKSFFRKRNQSDPIKIQSLPEPITKTIIKMVLQGLSQIHSLSLMHRDIKPANILLSQEDIIKIGDFGLATIYCGPNEEYSHEVASRWYRAPELLFGSKHYDQKVDIWAAGCLLGECMAGCPIFPGENDIDQIQLVFSLLGSPNTHPKNGWPDYTSTPDYGKILFDDRERKPFESIFPEASDDQRDLLEKMLLMDPKKRFSADEALKHPYFQNEPFPLQNLNDFFNNLNKQR